MRRNTIIGIDLVAKPTNPFGWALLEGSRVSVRQLLTDEEIVAETIRHAPALVAVDAPLGLPQDRQEHMRKADREMHRKGYPVLPPRFRSIRNLTLRAANIAFQLESSGLAIIEVHPASTRKALNIPGKDWKYIQKTLLRIGSKGDIRNRFLTPHEN